MTLTTAILAVALTADFGTETGKIRPELHSSGFGPTICSQTAQDLADVKAMGFAFARTHDWALINANERVCDYFHIFPLMHLDATKPENYVFGPTDYLLKRAREEAGQDVFYRLGTSIEHSGKKVHFNTAIPEDFDKVAEIFAGTVRHYNRGWANGFKWDIKYWEIWNEPDGRNNMWCLPEGDGDWRNTSPEQKALDEKRRDLFVKFFVKVLKRLKSEFGDTIKVGGPALCSYKEDYFRAVLDGCKAAGVAPDFISWHGYTNDQTLFADQAERGRKLLDGYGFANCEMIVNEWHYFGRDDYSWDDMQRCSDPKVKARIWSGPRSHSGIHSSCFTLATLANLQRSKLSQAYFYGCRHTGAWGFKDDLQAKYKVFYALKLFGDLVKKYPVICASTSDGAYTTLAVRSADGAKKALLVVDYGGKAPAVTVDVAGVDAGAKATCTLLDRTHDLTAHPVSFADGKLTLTKTDANSAAFLVEFGAAQTAARTVRQTLDDYVEKGRVAGVVSILGEADYSTKAECVGYADLETKRPMSADTVFAIFSMTKTLTGAAVMCAIEDGKIALDDPVSKYLPEFADIRMEDGSKPKRELTIRDVTSHVDGMRWEYPLVNTDISLREAARRYAAKPAKFQPGETFAYGTMRFSVAAAALEVATGERFEDYLRRKILDPLGMKDTTFTPNAEQLSRLVKAYTTDDKPLRPASDKCSRQLVFPKEKPLCPAPGGGLFSTPADIIRFSQMLAHHGTWKDKTIISRKTFDGIFAVVQVPGELGRKNPYTVGSWVYGDWFGHEGAMRTDQRANLRTGQCRLFFLETENKAGPAFFSLKRDWHKACDAVQGTPPVEFGH